MIGQGMTVWCVSDAVDKRQEAMVQRILTAMGHEIHVQNEECVQITLVADCTGKMFCPETILVQVPRHGNSHIRLWAGVLLHGNGGDGGCSGTYGFLARRGTDTCAPNDEGVTRT